MKPYSLLLVLLLAVAFRPNVALAQWVINGVNLSTGAGGQRDVAIVEDGAGGVIAAWSDTRLGGYDIFVQRLDAFGIPQWTHDGVALCIAGGTQENVEITSDGAGGAIATWEDYRSGPLPHIYARRVDASGLPLWTPDGVAICTAPEARNPEIDADGAGGAIVAWRDSRFQDVDVFVQRVNAMGVPQWTFNGVVLCDKPNTQINVAPLSDGTGGAIVAWSDRRSGTELDIYAQRVNSFGEPKWTAGGVPLCTAAHDQQGTAIAADGAGGAIVVWEDRRPPTTSDLYGQRVNTFGETQWMADGVAICDAGGNQVFAGIVSDGVGGAIAVWADTRSGAGLYDIFAQRVDASGVSLWEDDGVALCTEEARQYFPDIAADGAGGAVVSWYDERSGMFEDDIYAQRVDASGVPQWAPDGVTVCAASNEQSNPGIVSDGAGGAIVAWDDPRSGADVYAQRVLFYGGVPTGVRDTPTSLGALSPNFPNPFSGETTIDLSSIVFGAVEVEVFDVAGRKVRVMNRVDAGSKQMTFDGRDDAGQLLPSGVYFYRVRTNGAEFSRKMVIAR